MKQHGHSIPAKLNIELNPATTCVDAGLNCFYGIFRVVGTPATMRNHFDHFSTSLVISNWTMPNHFQQDKSRMPLDTPGNCSTTFSVLVSHPGQVIP
jgi:hypothetical protein